MCIPSYDVKILVEKVHIIRGYLRYKLSLSGGGVGVSSRVKTGNCEEPSPPPDECFWPLP